MRGSPVHDIESISSGGRALSEPTSAESAPYAAHITENAGDGHIGVQKSVLLPGLRSTHLKHQPFDEAYVERLRCGDLPTQEHFVAYFSDLLQIKLQLRLKSSEAIEDLRTETFARVFQVLRGGRIQKPHQLGSLLNATCNRVLSEYSHPSVRSVSLEDESPKDFAQSGMNGFPTKRSEKCVREILEKLSERDRRVLRAIFIEGRDKDQACSEVGVDREYLRSLLHGAIQPLRQELKKA